MSVFSGKTSQRMSRREMLCGIGGLGVTGAAAAILPGCPPGMTPNLDVAILNFALNLEYLEAEFYARAFGLSLDGDVGANPGPVNGGRPVTFTREYHRQYLREIAEDEIAHVRFLRRELGAAAVDRPAIDFTNAFDAAGQAAGLGAGFDPFANEGAFLAGAFIFEDVGVTAYAGGAPLITSPLYLAAAAGILATEAYHAATVRTTLWNLGDTQITVNALKLANSIKAHATIPNAVSDARDSLDGPSDIDQGISRMVGGEPVANIVPTDADGKCFSRTVAQVHNIAYLTPNSGVTSGGFFPEGTNNPNVAFTTT